MLDEDKTRAAHRALVDRILHGEGQASAEQRARAFGNDGLSYDFWEATMAWNLDLRALKQLCRNSLQYSAMTGGEKSAALARWEASWNRWIAAEQK